MFRSTGVRGLFLLEAPPIPVAPSSLSSCTVRHSTPETQADQPLTDRVVRIINLIRPAVQADGGDVEFVSLTSDGIVHIRLHGACVGCPSSTVTLQMGIERNLREHIPEVKGVKAID
jgi:Fe-S cluster biogenesis protein NfuA